MRKNMNQCHIEGYVYDISKLSARVTGPNSKSPGTNYIAGELNVAVDEEGLNVVPVYFSYVTEVYSKSGKPNSTYTALQTILNEADKTWLRGGKNAAIKVKIDGSIGLNDFISNGERVSAKRCEGSFVTIVSKLGELSERNTFKEDMVINRVNLVEANPERNINEDYLVVGGAVFNFRNELLPLEFVVKNPAGMKYFEDLDVSGAEPVYTKVWGRINSMTIKTEQTEESAFAGENVVTTYERTSREWLITGTAKVPYEYGDEEVMTAEELTTAVQNRETHWADIQASNEKYLAERANKTAAPAPSAPVKTGGFSF